jgi:hypothetical protein
VAAVVTCEAAEVTAGPADVTVPVVPLTTPDTADVAEPRTPPAEPWVAALAGPAVRRPMPKATHRPPIAAPQVYKNTFRASWHQPPMPVTLIHP